MTLNSLPIADPHWLGRLGRFGAVNLLAGGAYLLLGLAVAEFFAAFGLFPAPIWLPSSVAIVATLLAGAAVAPGLFIGSFITNAVLFEPPLWVAAVISIANAAGPILAATLIRRTARPSEVFASLRGLGAFVFAGILLHAAITATAGAVSTGLADALPGAVIADIWLTWWLSDSGGTLFLAPALLLWLVDHSDLLLRRRIGEGVVVSVATILGTVLLFTQGATEDEVIVYMPYLLALPLAWVTLRWSLRSAATLFTVIVTIATAGTMAGSGPFNAIGVDRPLTALGTMIVLCGINVLLTSALVSERRDMVGRLAALNRDLEIRVAERTAALEEARAAAETANAAKSQFLANMAHELRTPLNGVIGFAEALRAGIYGPPPDPRYDEVVALIERSGRHLMALVDGLLDLAKVEAGQIELERVEVDLNAAAREALALVAPMAAERQIQLEPPAGVAIPPVLGDPRATSEILHNLLSNAIKFNRPGGSVRVTLVVERDDVVLTVEDDGVGMTDAERVHALTRFGRADNAATRADRTGTGLGLPLAKALTEAQGGIFELRSRPGVGTAVRIAFPVPPRAGGPARHAAAQPSAT